MRANIDKEDGNDEEAQGQRSTGQLLGRFGSSEALSMLTAMKARLGYGCKNLDR